jgi:RNA polymerase-binding transcription factor DksA
MATKKKAVMPARSTSGKTAKATKTAKKQSANTASKSAKSASKSAPKKAAGKKSAPKKAAAKKVMPQKAAPKKAVRTAVTPKKAAPKKVQSAAQKNVASPVRKTTEQAKPAAKPQLPAKKAVTATMPAPAAPPAKEVAKPVQQLAKKEPPKPTKIIIPKTSTTKAVKYEPDFTKSVLDTNQSGKPGPTMRYSDTELQEFRELITRKLDTAKKELAYLQGLITRKDEGGDMEDGRYMTMEDGSMSMEREQLSQMASRQIQFIDHLEKAMMRIENKTYGVCRVTGKLIDKARLRAVPHATLSIEAKQLMNK